MPLGTYGKTIAELSPSAREARESAPAPRQLPIGANGRIAYEAIANAVKGRVAV